MSLAILNWTQPFSGLQGYVDVKFKDKVITVLVDHDFIETDSYALLRMFGHDGESWLSIPQKDVGSTSDFNKIAGGGVNARFRKQVFFKSVVYPGSIGKHPVVEIDVKDPVNV